jgi:cation transport protein ChaC
MTARDGRIVFDGPGDVWFFAYGSLMWDPGFEHVEVRQARLGGYHRAFCVRSEVYRGTPDRPGLTLGLDRGGSCRGLAFRVAERDRDAAARYLEQRELVEDIYFCRRVKLTSAGGRLDAYAFIVDDMARIIAGAAGEVGPNRVYLENTVAHLDALGIANGPLHEMLRRVKRIAG